jgi:uncharacterized membrane protein YkoI
MKRSSAIVSVLAATGVTLTLSLATLSMIATMSNPTSPTEVLTVAQPTVADPGFTLEPLPDLPSIAEISVTTDSVAQAPAAPQPTAQSNKEPTSAATTSSRPSPEVQARALITPDQAVAAVVSATPGKVASVGTATRNGIDAYAVQLQRPDNSVVTGYVDQSSGVVFDWVVNGKAPAPQNPAPASDDDRGKSDDRDDDHDDDDDDHDDDDHDDDDHDKHEGDDDDD